MRAICIAAAIHVTSGFFALSHANDSDTQNDGFAVVRDNFMGRRAALQQFSWNTYTVVSLKGQVRKIISALCRYGPDGMIYATPVDTPPPQSEPRGLRRRATETQADEMEDSIQEVMALAQDYVPPVPQKLEALFQNANALFVKKARSAQTHLQLTDYLKPGDSLLLSFDPIAKSLTMIDVTSYLAEETDVVTLHVVFQRLPDGTSYVASSVLNAIGRQIQVRTENENYRRLWQ
jgi:hypothetical protein